MADLRDKYNQLTHLDDFPEIARLVGEYVATFGDWELTLWHIYGIVLDMEEGDAMFLLGQIQSFSTRLECVKSFFQAKRADMTSNELINEILSGAKTINAFRNKLAHGVYLTDKEKSKVILRAYVTDPARSSNQPVTKDTTNFFELSAKILKDEAEKVRVSAAKISDLLTKTRPGKISLS
jgi:hypothetical protein